MLPFFPLKIMGMLLILCASIFSSQCAHAGIKVYATQPGGMSSYYCGDGTGTGSRTVAEQIHISYAGCNYSQGYPPHAGNFTNKVIVSGSSGSPIYGSVTTNPFYLDATKSLAEQSVETTGPGMVVVTVPANTSWKICNYLVDDAGNLYYMYQSLCGSNPVPPTPPIPDTSCTINNGNTLSVSLGTLERSEIPTAPGSGSAKSIPFAVNCTGGNVTVNMQMNYTPISVGSSQAVKTSANGVGVSVLYDNKPLSTTDITPVTFLQGSNTLNLSFEAVRDAAVKLEDIPTGAFTANAVLVMTQQ
ncbi:fimbrial protein [Cronobacter turicensis]|nr:fimbrial protein [Cronobacter turicensis]ELY4385274.1 fimbrial protein [Cronobacter turicensis]ELY6272071.1 fimbrial protein [Cronobacter turicensis]